MDFDGQLRVFVTVADNASFARAAEALRMRRPSVTEAINDLERDLGVRLLHRTTRRTSLTGEGEELYERATRLLGEIEETRNMFGGAGQTPHGRLRVDIPVALANPLVVPNLPAFQSAYPDIDLVLGVSDQPVDLAAEGVDLVLRIGALPNSSFVARKLASLTMIVCAAPSYLAKHGTPARVDDLDGHRAVNYFSGRGHRPMPWSLPTGDPRERLLLRSAVMVNDTNAFVGCALAGLGLIQVPGLSVERYLASGELVQVLPTMAEVRWPLSAMYPHRQYLAPQVRVFIDWMRDVLAEAGSPWME